MDEINNNNNDTSIGSIGNSNKQQQQQQQHDVPITLFKNGEVRATPFGSLLSSKSTSTTSTTTTTGSQSEISPSSKSIPDNFHQWRNNNMKTINFPVEGYYHMYGQPTIDTIDQYPLGSNNNMSVVDDNDNENNNNDNEEKKSSKNAIKNNTNYVVHDYGNKTRTVNDAPIGSLQDKWRLLPYFLQLRSLLRQHIESFNYFVSVEMQQIISSPSNYEIRSEYDPKFFLRYENVTIGTPCLEDETTFQMSSTTPAICRLRDCSYTAPIYVTVRYTRGRQIIVKRNVLIGRLPIMLRSNHCILYNKNDNELLNLQECPYDPGGYFIIKGTEKVILIQEQLSKNRVILEEDTSSSSTPGAGGTGSGTGTTSGGYASATITSSTHERKSKAYILIKHGKGLYLRSNSFGGDDIPIVIILKALGIESDIEIVQLVGTESYILQALSYSLEEATRYRIVTQHHALKYIGTKIQSLKNPTSGTGTNVPTDPHAPGGSGTTGSSSSYRKIPILPEDEAREVLANVILNHVPVEKFNFRPKAIYIGNIVRRVLLVHLKKMPYDDKDYYGNKRLELAGSLISLLFEDLFKLFNSHLKRQADIVLSKPNRAQAFDIVKSIRPDTITNGMITAIATGNWILKRFRMDRAGVTQVLTRLSYMSAIGMMTRINSQFEKTRKVSGPRSLQSSQWGMLCPADTPEGEACGLVKNLALLAHITTDDTTTSSSTSTSGAASIDGVNPDNTTGSSDNTGTSNSNTTGKYSIERLCYDLGVEDVCRMTGNELHCSAISNSFIIFLNGLLIGIHTQPYEFVTNVRTMRRRGRIGEFVSVYIHDGQRAVHIATDGGRVCRPLIIIDTITGLPKLKQYHLESLVSGLITIKDLLQQGIVEYVDCNEENNTLIALTERDLEVAIIQNKNYEKQQQQQQLEGNDSVPLSSPLRYTHLEVDPFTILGVIGGIIPYPHHNQAPRNTYTVAMAKQAMGTIGINAYERVDGLIYTKVYPQKILVKSRTLDLLQFDKIPGGQNACIAVMSYSGYDIEDAIVINKASIDRGYGRCMVFKKYQTSVRKYTNGTMDRTCGAPDPSEFPDGIHDKRYKKFTAIDQDGICRVGEKLDNGMYMVNKESPTDTVTNLGIGSDFGIGTAPILHNVQYKSAGISYRSSAPSYVNKVVITCNEHTSMNYESFMIKIMTRQVRRPEIGDKFASRHGQKGVCGLIVQQADMPFNELGQCPDLIMNPHGFPSRMTIGKLLELVVGKAALFEGRQGYSTAFGEEHGSADTHESASETLIRNGWNYQGKDILYSGTNGEPLDAYIFTGPVFYQKLKHMVLDKAHARARGPRAVLTRQPTEGRSRDGGLRLGEMERDCLIAYGVSNLIMERLMHSSDAFSTSVCLTCGLLQYVNWCQYCRSGEQVTNIRLPYACKLLFQELQSMNVLPRLRLADHS
jgi:DNA-directed RNA polymerase III subunit RPC2